MHTNECHSSGSPGIYLKSEINTKCLAGHLALRPNVWAKLNVVARTASGQAHGLETGCATGCSAVNWVEDGKQPKAENNSFGSFEGRHDAGTEFGFVKRIYVGNLPWSTTDEELNELFAPFGAVNSAVVIKDRDTDRSRGFGFVEMEGAEADRAIAELNGQDMGSRPLRVTEANERPQRRGGPRRD
jgi:hypothetical protein